MTNLTKYLYNQHGRECLGKNRPRVKKLLLIAWKQSFMIPIRLSNKLARMKKLWRK